MRATATEKLERGRLINPLWQSPHGAMYGAFIITGPSGRELKIIADDGAQTGWEHVSVSLENRPPNWAEMSFVKEQFWDDEECVIQYHPPRSEYVNNHPFCLHMWRPKNADFPMPPSILVGIK